MTLRSAALLFFVIACGRTSPFPHGDGAPGVTPDPCGCASNQYCDRKGLCKNSQKPPALCTTRPENCPTLYSPVCGCDLQVYPNECEAKSSGVDVNLLGGCKAPDALIPCGYAFCSPDTTYCRKVTNDFISPNDPAPFSAGCEPLPPACKGSTDCKCFGTTSCQCKTLGKGFEVTCPGG